MSNHTIQCEHYDAKECFDIVFSNDSCPALREVFQCVTLPGATCPVCKEVFHYQLSSFRFMQAKMSSS